MTRMSLTGLMLLLAIMTPARAVDLSAARERIEQHRKADLKLQVVAADGQPVPGVRLRIEQTASEFKFGANIFLFGFVGERDEAYLSRFNQLFNFATLPYYWWSYEMQPGQTEAPRMRRIIAWCEEHRITPKGHPLFWSFREQDWLPADPNELRKLALERVHDTAKEFAGRIEVWDVVNEASQYERVKEAPKLVGMLQEVGLEQFIRDAFAAARRADPNAVLLINDYDTSERYERLIESLRNPDGSFPFDAIGIQSHMHAGEWPTEKIHDVCTRFGRFGLPLHFTEVTILSGEHGWSHKPWNSTPEFKRRQAEEVERVYTELFAQPMVAAITWWDLSDEGAWRGAPAGLLDRQMQPKPAYEVLDRLINQDWRTGRLQGATDADGAFAARVFRGDYAIQILGPGEPRTVHVRVGRDGLAWDRTDDGTFTSTGEVVRIELAAAEQSSRGTQERK